MTRAALRLSAAGLCAILATVACRDGGVARHAGEDDADDDGLPGASGGTTSAAGKGGGGGQSGAAGKGGAGGAAGMTPAAGGAGGSSTDGASDAGSSQGGASTGGGGGIAPPFDGPLNVLFITVDDLGPQLGTYGIDRAETPAMDALASRGLRFDRAYSQAPHCAPSRASFLSGRHPGSSGGLSLPEAFRQAGFFTARVGKIFHQGVPDGIGTNGSDNNKAWVEFSNPKGVDVAEESGAVVVPSSLSYRISDSPEEQHTDGLVAAEGIRILRAAKDKRFFLALGFYRPHEPFIAPKKYFDLHPLDRVSLPQTQPGDANDVPSAALESASASLSADQARAVRRAYRACTSFVDAQIGKVLAELERLGLASKTIVVVAGDHGYALGEHGLWKKKNLFEVGARVPLIVSGPGLRAGQSSHELIELLDLYPTLARLANVSVPQGLEGGDFSQYLRGVAAVGPRLAAVSICESGVCKTPGKSIRDGRYRFTHWEGGGLELYDHEKDPNEWTNLAQDGALEGTRRRLSDLLAAPFADLLRKP